MVSSISLPVYPKWKLAHDDCKSLSDSCTCGSRTPTTASPASSYTLSPNSNEGLWDEAHSAFILLHERYDMMNGNSVHLGTGSGGCVWSGVCRQTSATVAVKTISCPAYGGPSSQESLVLEKLQQVNGVVRLIDCYSDEDSEIIVMEMCEGDDLQKWKAGALTVSDIKNIMTDLLLCIRGIHEQGISHGDIRLENVIVHLPEKKDHMVDIPAPCMKLVDFGSSIQSTAEACFDYISAGQLLFEHVMGERASISDIWACRELPAPYGGALDFIWLLLSTTPTNLNQTGKHALNHAWLID